MRIFHPSEDLFHAIEERKQALLSCSLLFLKQQKEIFGEMNVKQMQMDADGNGLGSKCWDAKEDGDDIYDSASIGTISEDSMNSELTSSELAEEEEEEASSSSSYLSSSSSSSVLSNGPLYELSELMTHLPIKRGLSMFYQGKAQSFTSLARVQSIEDLPKKTPPYRKKMKPSKSYGGGLDSHRISYTPKATISKKASRGSFLTVVSKRGSLMEGPRHKNF